MTGDILTFFSGVTFFFSGYLAIIFSFEGVYIFLTGEAGEILICYLDVMIYFSVGLIYTVFLVGDVTDFFDVFD